jgi:hypothetical protein
VRIQKALSDKGITELSKIFQIKRTLRDSTMLRQPSAQAWPLLYGAIRGIYESSVWQPDLGGADMHGFISGNSIRNPRWLARLRWRASEGRNPSPNFDSPVPADGDEEARVAAARVRQMRGLGFTLVSFVIFVLSFPTEPLYYSNQNTKFLHGLAQAGMGNLATDWTAATIDGLPVFSFIVYFTAKYLSPYIFYVYQVAVLSLLLWTLLELACSVAGLHGKIPRFRILLGAAIVAAYAWGSLPTWSLLGGIAEQDLVGGGGEGFQPSDFGVFLLLGILLLLRGKVAPAILSWGVAAVLLPAYISCAATLLISFVVLLRLKPEEGVRFSWWAFLVAAGIVSASMMDVAWHFRPTNADLFARANDILAYVRIPHHSDPKQWNLYDVAAKSALVGTALWVFRRERIGIIIAVPLVAVVVGTAVALLTHNAPLALIAPWRCSTFLVPLAFFLLLARGLSLVMDHLEASDNLTRSVRCALFGIVALALGIPVVMGSEQKFASYISSKQPAHFVFIRTHSQPGDLYLTDIGDDNFRLETLTPQFVSWKTHPYKDIEVIEWYARAQRANQVFSFQDMDGRRSLNCDALAQLARDYPLTHVVVSTGEVPGRIECSFLTTVFEDANAKVFRINRQGMDSNRP